MIELKRIGTNYKEIKPVFLLKSQIEKGFNTKEKYKIIDVFLNQWDTKVYYIKNNLGNIISMVDSFSTKY